MLTLGGGIYFGVDYAVERAVIADAKDKALHWADYFRSVMPDLPGLIATGKPTGTQDTVIGAAQRVGGVFRFKLYDSDARQVFVTDDAAAADEEDDAESPDHNDAAAAAMASHSPVVAVSDEHEKGMPPLFVEAYLPIAEGGEPHGVVEVYIDQTGTAALFRTTFAVLAIGLAVVAALAFGVPTLAFVFRGRQVSEARRAATFLAQYDPLTRVFNRATFTARLDAALREDKADLRSLSLIFVDLDHFQTINDTHGHAIGDALLKHVAETIKGAGGPSDVCGRIGGDEFVVLVARPSERDVLDFVGTVVAAMRQPFTVAGHTIVSKVSAGIYHLEPGASAADALHRADVALYQAKADGRDTYRVFSIEIDEAMTARRVLEGTLAQATRDRAFELHFQPIVNASTRKLLGFEALLRLGDGSRQIPPAVFIPVAEHMGLIGEIGAWVLEEATRIAARWPAELFVAVNLSAHQFEDGVLLGQVQAALTASGLQASQLELELTESVLIEDADRVGAQLRDLKQLGVSIAMDDFGTGYSSLAYLWKFAFDKLKIDRSFVSALDANEPRAREILDTIVLLAHKLDIAVTAEGIETEHQAHVLSQLSADQLQGYLFGRPIPATDLAAWLIGQERPRDSRNVA